ncbi:hypothetical protein DFH29DRAFT_880545 [Suillus ampliporus]|nr:hypothetical protein DFH29DRAFT_880545 [Suillus ampliporus]
MSSKTCFMPLSTSSIAPQFTGITSELLPFFHKVAQLSDTFGLWDEACITAALRYADKYEADLWTYLEETSGDNYEEFANAVLRLYPEAGHMHYYRPQPVEVIIDEESEVKSPAPVLSADAPIPSTDSSVSSADSSAPSADVIACMMDDLSSDEYKHWDDLLSEEYVHWSDIFDPFTDELSSINKLPFYDNIKPSTISETLDSISDTYPQIIAPLASQLLIDLSASNRTRRTTNKSTLSAFSRLTVSNASWAVSQKYCPETALHDPSLLPVLHVVAQEAGVMDVGNPSIVFTLHDPSSLPVLRVVTQEAGVMDVDFPSTILTVPSISRISSILRLSLLRRHLEFTSALPSNDFRVIQDIPDDHIGLLASYSCICFNDLLQIESASDPQSHKDYQSVTHPFHPSTNDPMTVYLHAQVSTLHMSPSHTSSALSALWIRRIASVQSLQEATHTSIQAQDQSTSHPSAPSNTTHPETSDPCSIRPNERIPYIQRMHWYQYEPSYTVMTSDIIRDHALNENRQTQEYISLGTSPPSEYHTSDHMVGIDVDKPDEEEPDSNIGA